MATYKSAYSGPQIDEAIGRVLNTGGFVPTIHEGTAPAVGGSYRQTVLSSYREAYLVDVQYKNANGYWYSLSFDNCTTIFLQCSSICELRFGLTSGATSVAGRPIRALILAR